MEVDSQFESYGELLQESKKVRVCIASFFCMLEKSCSYVHYVYMELNNTHFSSFHCFDCHDFHAVTKFCSSSPAMHM